MVKKKKIMERIFGIFILSVVLLGVIIALYSFFLNPMIPEESGSEDDKGILSFVREYIYINGNITDFYYKKENEKLVIFLERKGINVKIADIRDGKIILTDEYLSDGKIDPEAYFFQRQRFLFENSFENFLKQLQELHGANYNHSEVFRDNNLEKIEILSAWPDNSVGIKYINTSELNLQIYKEKLKVDFPGIEIPKDYKFRFLYFEKQEGYVEVKGYRKKWSFPFSLFQKDYSNVAKFYPDGSVWVDTKLLEILKPKFNQFQQGEFDFGAFYVKSRGNAPLSWESNLKLQDYKFFEKGVETFESTFKK